MLVIVPRARLRLRFSQSVSYFTVPPRAHPSAGSQSGSATVSRITVPRKYRAKNTNLRGGGARLNYSDWLVTGALA